VEEKEVKYWVGVVVAEDRLIQLVHPHLSLQDYRYQEHLWLE